jgi:hypothetical protein
MRALLPALSLAAILTGRLAAPAEAVAQFRPLRDTIAVGGTLGAGLGAPLDRGFELGGTIEIPIGIDFRVRADAAVGLWRYDADPYRSAPGETFGRHRIVGSLIKSLRPMTPRVHMGSYAGGGAGVYITRFSTAPDAVSAGGHALWGLEFLSPEQDWLISTEVQVLFVQEPHASIAGGKRSAELGLHAGIWIKKRL